MVSENDNKKRLIAIGSRVKLEREKMGLTQEQFADKYGYARSTISKLEAGLRDFKSTEIITLAEQLNVSCDFLLGRSLVTAPDEVIQEVVTRYGLSEQSLQELSATVNLAAYYKQHKVIDNPFEQFIEALNTIICNESVSSTTTLIWRFLFAPVDGVKIIESPLSVLSEWNNANVNDNSNGGERALNESEVISYRLMQLNNALSRLRDKLTVRDKKWQA